MRRAHGILIPEDNFARMSDNAEQRAEMPVEYSSRIEGAWERAIAEGDKGPALEAARAAQARFQHDGSARRTSRRSTYGGDV